MIVPRSFSHISALPTNTLDEKRGARQQRKSTMSKSEKRTGLRPATPARTTTEPALPVSTSSVAGAVPMRNYSTASATAGVFPARVSNNQISRSSAHDPLALPPAVAALLAITQGSSKKSAQYQRTRSDQSRRVSIKGSDSGRKSNEIAGASYSSSPALSILLEGADSGDEQFSLDPDSFGEDTFLSRRSTSSDSVPSLDADERSILSNGSLSTPASVRSRRSISNLRKEKPRSVPTIEECDLDHPLIPAENDEDFLEEEFVLATNTVSKESRPKTYSRFTSNLTLSLQTLKNAALNSISSFSANNPTASVAPSLQQSSKSPFPDDVLWSHPFLFPRFSPEIRPPIQGDATEAQQRYLNPTPLTFEEQEAPYQLALHAPYLAEAIPGAPTIQMQTYARGKRKSGSKRGGLDPQSEAGRALLGAAGMRQREPRENSDFLRVVVLEMNMRRSGKLETGRAKIWLPPRKVGPNVEAPAKVPRRWVGESAY